MSKTKCTSGSAGTSDRILEAESDDVNRYKASKQADALMLLYLMSSDELLERLGYRFTPDQIPLTGDYYLARRFSSPTFPTSRAARRPKVFS